MSVTWQTETKYNHEPLFKSTSNGDYGNWFNQDTSTSSTSGSRRGWNSRRLGDISTSSKYSTIQPEDNLATNYKANPERKITSFINRVTLDNPPPVTRYELPDVSSKATGFIPCNSSELKDTLTRRRINSNGVSHRSRPSSARSSDIHIIDISRIDNSDTNPSSPLERSYTTLGLRHRSGFHTENTDPGSSVLQRSRSFHNGVNDTFGKPYVYKPVIEPWRSGSPRSPGMRTSQYMFDAVPEATSSLRTLDNSSFGTGDGSETPATGRRPWLVGSRGRSPYNGWSEDSGTLKEKSNQPWVLRDKADYTLPRTYTSLDYGKDNGYQNVDEYLSEIEKSFGSSVHKHSVSPFHVSRGEGISGVAGGNLDSSLGHVSSRTGTTKKSILKRRSGTLDGHRTATFTRAHSGYTSGHSTTKSQFGYSWPMHSGSNLYPGDSMLDYAKKPTSAKRVTFAV